MGMSDQRDFPLGQMALVIFLEIASIGSPEPAWLLLAAVMMAVAKMVDRK